VRNPNVQGDIETDDVLEWFVEVVSQGSARSKETLVGTGIGS
jgi:hypothetical protein